MKKILITGSSGFIGTNLMGTLIENSEFSILGIDLLVPKIESHNRYYKRADVRDEARLKVILEEFNPNFIIHLAARTDLDGLSIDDYTTNTIGVAVLSKVIEGLELIERVIFTSSMYVCMPGYSPKNDDDYNPHTIYGESKVISEKIVKDSFNKCSWTIVRPTSIWGPHFAEPYKNFFEIIISNKYFHMGPRACTKTYGFVDNTVRQILSLLIAESNKVDKETFYLGDKDPYSISEWADEIAFAACGKKIRSLPFFIFKCASLVGDFISFFGINFPITSFRLRNMTTDNVYDLHKIHKIYDDSFITRKEGIKMTLDWMMYNRSVMDVKLFDIIFINGDYKDAFSRLKKGQCMVAPSGPGLSTIDKDGKYWEALKAADFSIPDSGFMVILARIFFGYKINKLSGPKFLRKFLEEDTLRYKETLFCIDPDQIESDVNNNYLNNIGIPISKSYHYVAPYYEKDNIVDYKLLEILESLEVKPKFLLINLGGGVQERLCYFIKNHLSYNISIICTGAAIAFETGQQSRLPRWVDSIYLGWLVRIINNPTLFIKRYIKAFRLFYVFYLDKKGKLI